MKPNQTIIDLAKSYGFDGAEFEAEWNGFQVFNPTVEKGKDIPIIGEPVLILYDGKDTRVATFLEWQDFVEYQKSKEK